MSSAKKRSRPVWVTPPGPAFLLVLLTCLFPAAPSVPAAEREVGNAEAAAGTNGLSEKRSIYPASVEKVLNVAFTVKDRRGLKALMDYRSGDPEPKPVKLIFKELDNEGNTVFEEKGTVRLRGRSTRGASVKSFKVNLSSKGKLWKGEFQSLNFNKHPWDFSRVRNKLSFDLFTEIPHFTSLRTYFVILTINGASQGLYTFIENAKTRFLMSHGLDPAGQLYKANNFAFMADELAKMKKAPKKFFVKEENLELESGKKDHSKIIKMLEALHSENGDIDDFVSRYLSRDNYLTWMAVNILLQNIDTINQNFYLYSPSTSEKWYFLPWDYDGALGKYEQIGSFERWQYRLKPMTGLANYWRIPLHRRFLSKQANFQDLNKMVTQIRTRHLTDEKVAALIDRYKSTTYDILTRPPDIMDLGGPSKGLYRSQFVVEVKKAYDGELERLKEFVSQSYRGYLSSLEAPMPVFMSIDASDTDIRFVWDRSHDFQGDDIGYEFQLYRSPFRATPESKGIPVATDRIYQEMVLERNELRLERSKLKLAPGTYFWRVLIQDLDSTGSPKGNWQVPFASYYDGANDLLLVGMKSFSVSEDGTVWE
jgi:spore coat protein H